MHQIDLRIVRAHDGPLELDSAAWSAWDLPCGEAGEMLVAGPHVLPGYLDDPEAEQANKVRDGALVWHRTGDGGRLDSGGRLWLMGRVKQRVRRDGRTWWPLPAEIAAMEEPGAAHAAYLGMADPAHGERAVLCVETARERCPVSGASRSSVAWRPGRWMRSSRSRIFRAIRGTRRRPMWRRSGRCSETSLPPDRLCSEAIAPPAAPRQFLEP